MNANIVRKIDLNELEELAIVGGNDNTPNASPDAITTLFCAVVATITVVTIVSCMLTTVEEIC
jgi:hypothetical protein